MRVVALALNLTACVVAGCQFSGPPPALRWVEAAPADLLPTQLILEHFSLPDRPQAKAMLRNTFAEPAVRVALAGMPTVYRRADADPEAFAAVFDAGPGLGTLIRDGEGTVVQARAGYLGPAALCRMVAAAREGYPRLRAALQRRRALPLRGVRAAQAEASFAIAEAYAALGNQTAAGVALTDCTLLAAPPQRALRARAAARLARMAAAEGGAAEAREWLMMYRENDPQGRSVPAAHLQLTEALLAQAERRLQDARRILDKLRHAPLPADAGQFWLAWAQVSHETGAEPEARAALARILRRWPDSRWAEAARWNLEHFDDPDSHSHGPGGHRH